MEQAILQTILTIWRFVCFGIMIITNVIIMFFTKGEISQNEEAVRTLIDAYPLYMAFLLQASLVPAQRYEDPRCDPHRLGLH